MNQRSSDSAQKIALLGNPNIGKTSLFNQLCGLRQKTGNYPGVTVEKRTGEAKHNGKSYELIDLPGINSLYPTSADEELVLNFLMNREDVDFPDKFVVVVSAINLKRNLYLFDQVRDLNIPIILAVNMTDISSKRGIEIDKDILSKELGVPVVFISAKKGLGLDELFNAFENDLSIEPRNAHYIEDENREVLQEYAKIQQTDNLYLSFLNLTQIVEPENQRSNKIRQEFIDSNHIETRKWKTNESILRYKFINKVLALAVNTDQSKAVDLTSRLDRILLHKVWGYVIFLLILFGIFQSIFWLAAYPMDAIDAGFASLSEWTAGVMPEGYFTQMITDGVIPGIGGVVIFIPQIAILFLFFSILEESGYMSRIVYLMDRLMQRFGMSGKSVVPLISGMACSIPAIMAARTIENKKEWLITIMVTPLMTCSARIPVYVILIALVVPDTTYGIFNLQGIALMGMYLLGIFMALIAAFVMKKLLKSNYKSYLILEMPEYLKPGIKNVLISMWTNSKAFIWNAGRIILAVAIILFVLGTNGFEKFHGVEEDVRTNYSHLTEEEQDVLIQSQEMEYSILGTIGKTIEPAIRPLGYDWKIGVAIISSLAAREVFVGTISTIYSINSEEEGTIKERLAAEKDPVTGLGIFNLATCISLLLFYAFSLQCLSTVAVTYKETKSIKWTAIQFLYMGILAYFVALIAYQILA